MSLNRGDKLAHYTIESMLGSGGMGAVYLAVDSRLHRRVALKVILDSDKPQFPLPVQPPASSVRCARSTWS